MGGPGPDRTMTPIGPDPWNVPRCRSSAGRKAIRQVRLHGQEESSEEDLCGGGPVPGCALPPGSACRLAYSAVTWILCDVTFKLRNVRKEIVSDMKAANIRKFLRDFTKIPHLAGTEQNLLLAQKIQAQWRDFGLDKAELVPYDVLLSYPNKSSPNYISIIDEHGTEIFSTSLSEPPPEGYENFTDIVPPYNAFSAKGENLSIIRLSTAVQNRSMLRLSPYCARNTPMKVYGSVKNTDYTRTSSVTCEKYAALLERKAGNSGDLVYVNYARTEDFFFLVRNMSINCTGKIVIARYGKIFRGNKSIV
ncbi:unnamed protein product [Ranitomeya imitator]|uniref:Uncharacterized protein n=1 Tax=Ranitomeya imitator TaxID=111125 RepID=A0ABN9KP41_9NEOB|nr:unnamed protein product [Ranitomeya imitator]